MMSGRGVRGPHLQEDPGDPPPVVAGLGGGVEVLEDAGRQLHLAGQVLLQLAHVAALELAAGVLLCQAPMPALPVRLHAHPAKPIPSCASRRSLRTASGMSMKQPGGDSTA